jgi:hypothetical protein
VEAFQRHLADRLDLHIAVDLGIEALLDEDLPPVASSASRDARFVTTPIAA